jgi:hypothetical protein
MRFGLALDLWCKGDADAPVPPKPKSQADVARDKLLAVVKKYKLDPRKLGQRFVDDYGMQIAEADAEAVNGFRQIVEDEAKIDQAAG